MIIRWSYITQNANTKWKIEIYGVSKKIIKRPNNIRKLGVGFLLSRFTKTEKIDYAFLNN